MVEQEYCGYCVKAIPLCMPSLPTQSNYDYQIKVLTSPSGLMNPQLKDGHIEIQHKIYVVLLKNNSIKLIVNRLFRDLFQGSACPVIQPFLDLAVRSTF